MAAYILKKLHTFQFMAAGLTVAALLLGQSWAYAGPIRAARSVLLGTKATQTVMENSGDEEAAKTNAKLERLKHKPTGAVV